jgi:hypothetical protein
LEELLLVDPQEDIDEEIITEEVSNDIPGLFNRGDSGVLRKIKKKRWSDDSVDN